MEKENLETVKMSNNKTVQNRLNTRIAELKKELGVYKIIKSIKNILN